MEKIKPIFGGIKDGKVITGKSMKEVMDIVKTSRVRPFKTVEDANKRLSKIIERNKYVPIHNELNAIDRMYGSRQLREIAIEVAKKSGISDSKALERLVQAEKEAEVFRGKLSAFLPVIKG